MRVFIIAAISADGFIGQNQSQISTDWTSAEDRRHFVELTKKAGAVVMGHTTYKTIGRPLPGRRNIIYTRGQLTDSRLEGTNLAPKELIASLKSEGVEELAICGGSSVYNMFLQAGVVDELYLTVEPVIFGQGVPLLNQPISQPLQLKSIVNLNANTLSINYEVIR